MLECWEPHGLRRGKEGFLVCPIIHCGATTGCVDPPSEACRVATISILDSGIVRAVVLRIDGRQD